MKSGITARTRGSERSARQLTFLSLGGIRSDRLEACCAARLPARRRGLGSRRRGVSQPLNSVPALRERNWGWEEIIGKVIQVVKKSHCLIILLGSGKPMLWRKAQRLPTTCRVAFGLGHYFHGAKYCDDIPIITVFYGLIALTVKRSVRSPPPPPPAPHLIFSRGADLSGPIAFGPYKHGTDRVFLVGRWIYGSSIE